MLAAADNFAYMAQQAETEGYDLAFWDTHGLDRQRYYTILCLHYGANPDPCQSLADELDFPTERQETCPQEVRRYFKGLQHETGGNPLSLQGADVASFQRLQPLANRPKLGGALQTPDISHTSRWWRVV